MTVGVSADMDVLTNLPGSSVKEPSAQETARSSYHDPSVKRAVEALDPYRSDRTWERDASKPPRSKGGPA